MAMQGQIPVKKEKNDTYAEVEREVSVDWAKKNITYDQVAVYTLPTVSLPCRVCYRVSEVMFQHEIWNSGANEKRKVFEKIPWQDTGCVPRLQFSVRCEISRVCAEQTEGFRRWRRKIFWHRAHLPMQISVGGEQEELPALQRTPGIRQATRGTESRICACQCKIDVSGDSAC